VLLFLSTNHSLINMTFVLARINTVKKLDKKILIFKKMQKCCQLVMILNIYFDKIIHYNRKLDGFYGINIS